MKHIVLFLLLAAALRPARAAERPDGNQAISDEVVRKVDPSVVAIQHERAVGSGFIISADGYILSNGHVVQGNDEEDPTQPAKAVTVVLANEQKFPARVIGFSMDPDVSLLKIDAGQPLQPVEFAD
jgi:S1-C subfamily serine protease